MGCGNARYSRGCSEKVTATGNVPRCAWIGDYSSASVTGNLRLHHIYVNAFSWNWLVVFFPRFKIIFCLLLPEFNTGWVFRSDFGVPNSWGLIQAFQRSLIVRDKGTLNHIFAKPEILETFKKWFFFPVKVAKILSVSEVGFTSRFTGIIQF